MAKKPIILIKRVRAHTAHHGGSWKVAYADFVTAMMALFIVLWLMNTSDHVRKVIAGYFNDPRGSSALTGSDRAGSADNLPLTRENMDQFKERLEKAIQQTRQFKVLSKQIEITVTPEGLRIELLETKNGTFFDTGSATLNDTGREFLTMLAGQLKDVPNHISIEGHTDSQPYANDAGYSNWELSADRANAARRLMQEKGLRGNQVSQVRGYADQRLRLPQNPLDPSNRRISLIVQYLEVSPSQPAGKPTENAAPAPSEPASTTGMAGNVRLAPARPADH
ncbi:MAG: OmpA family protein [Silvibacterium sp.]|nr:OmpA family protein [Silvibacterium sp.]